MTLAILLTALFVYQSPGASEYAQAGKKYYLAGDFKKSVGFFEKAVKLEPDLSHHLWLGRAYGRLAENSGFISAPKYALQVRLHFEKAIKLDPRNLEALGDLFDYYLNVPRFLGGGIEKAKVLASKIGRLNRAEGRCANARLAEKRKKYKEAERYFREAI